MRGCASSPRSRYRPSAASACGRSSSRCRRCRRSSASRAADASLPYTLTMLGFGFGGILMGRLSDRFGIVVPVVVGAFALALGYCRGRLRPRACGSSPSCRGC